MGYLASGCLITLFADKIIAEILDTDSAICNNNIMKLLTKNLLLTILSLSGFIDGVLLFGAMPPHNMWWFNPFIGLLYLIVLPFAGAIIILYGENSNKSSNE